MNYDTDTVFSEQPVANSVVRIRSRKTDAGTWTPLESYSGTTGLRTFWGATFGDTSGNALITGSLTTVNLVPPTIVWGETVASPGLTHTARTTDAATTDLTLTSQGPVAGASTNKNPGNVVLTVPAPAAGGTTGHVACNVSGAEVWQAYASGTYQSQANVRWAKSVASPIIKHDPQTTDAATTDLTIKAQGPYASATGTNRNSGSLILQTGAAAGAGTPGTIQLSVADAGTLSLDTTSLTWAKSVATPQMVQAAQTTDTATFPMNVGSQAPYASATGTNRNPGNLTLQVPAPASGGVAGCIKLQVSGSSVLEADPAKIFVATTTGAPGSNPTGGVYLYLEGDVLKYRTSGGTVKSVTVT